MRRFALRLAIALLTFTIGTLVTLLWVVPHFKPPLNNSHRQQDSMSAAPPLGLQCAGANKPTQKGVEAGLRQTHSTSWRTSVTKVGGGERLYEVQFVSDDEGWVGGEKGALYKTSDGGKLWHRIKLDVPAESEIVSIDFLNPSLGWVVAAKHDYADDDRSQSWVYQTADGGQTWRFQYGEEKSEVVKVVFVSEQEGWLTGVKYIGLSPLRRTFLVLHTNDQGRHWADVSDGLKGWERDENNGVTDFYAAGNGSALILDFYHQMFSTADEGKSWKQVLSFPEEPPESYMHRFGFLGDNRLWAVGGADGIEGMWGTLAHMNADCSWTLDTSGDFWLVDATFLSEEHVLACGSIPSLGGGMMSGKRDGLIVESQDLGANWEIVYRNPKAPSIYTITKAGANNIWAVGGNGYVLHLQR